MSSVRVHCPPLSGMHTQIKKCIIWKIIWTHFLTFLNDQFERHVFNYTTIDKVSSVFCQFSLKWQCFCQPLKKVTVYLLTIVADAIVFCQTSLRMTVHYVKHRWGWQYIMSNIVADDIVLCQTSLRMTLYYVKHHCGWQCILSNIVEDDSTLCQPTLT